MNVKSTLGAIISVLIFFFSALSCSTDTPARVTINLGLPGNEYSIKEKSVIDHILDFFSTPAFAQTAPSNITLITLNISAADMTTINQTYPAGTSSITISVPPGDNRLFALTATIDPADPGAVLSYEGSAQTNLSPGETVDLPVSMVVGETKLVIPDYYNYRVVQINNMTGAGWSEMGGTIIPGFSSYFLPSDIAFDSTGRIYIALNHSGSAGPPRVIRVDNISSTVADVIISDSGPMNVNSIALDRNNNIFYYANSSSLYSSNLDGTNQTLFSTPFTNIRGVAVDNDGMVYVAHENQVSKFNPGTDSIIGTPYTVLNESSDVLVKSSALYAADSTLLTGKIIQLDLNLNLQAELPDSASNDMYGPRRFVAILNEKITFIDEEGGTNNADKLVSMDNISGDNWETYGTYGSGTGQFQFYYFC